MRKIVFLLIIVVSLCECEKDITTLDHWTKIFEGPYKFWSVFFPSTDTGYVVGSLSSLKYSPIDTAVVLKTVDSGSTWKKLSLPEAIIGNLFSVYFTDTNIGYIGGGTQDNTAIILKTINGGTTWMILNLPNEEAKSNRIRQVYFTDANNGYAIGTKGVIFKTIDSGNTWTALDLPIETVEGLNSIYFIDSSTGYVLGYREPPYSINKFYMVILKTNDGGTTWSASLDNSSIGSWGSVYFTDANTGYAVGYKGTVDSHQSVIYKTIDGGITWTVNWSHDPIGSSTLSSVYFVDSNTGYAIGTDYLKTIDGGTTWTTLDIPDGLAGLNSFYFTNTTTGYLVGTNGMANGIILKTITGGK